MKRNSIFMAAIIAVFIAAAGMKPVHQDDPPGIKKNAHIRIVTVRDGKEHVVDTIIEGGKVKVFHTGKGKEFVWTTAVGEKLPDSLMEHLEVIKEGADGKNIIIRQGAGKRGIMVITESETVGDSGKKVIVHMEKSDPGKGNVIIRRPVRMPGRRLMHAPLAPGIDFPLSGIPLRRHLSVGNVIDLTDPGIISYEKKKLPGGKEKITIIRNELKETEEKVIEIRTGDEIRAEPLKDLRGVHREIKVKKEVLKPEEIEKK